MIDLRLDGDLAAIGHDQIRGPNPQVAPARAGLVLLGGGAVEAPEVYRRLPDVLAAHGDTIRVKHTLQPLGAALAGRTTRTRT